MSCGMVEFDVPLPDPVVWIADNGCATSGFDVVALNAGREGNDPECCAADVEDAEVGDGSADDGSPGERQGAGGEEFGVAGFGGVVHDDDYAFGAVDEARTATSTWPPWIIAQLTPWERQRCRLTAGPARVGV